MLNNIVEEVTRVLDTWITPIGILIMTLIAGEIFRRVLKFIGKKEHVAPLRQLAPAISNLIYIVGLRMVTATLPIHQKFVLWIENAIYVFGVVVVLWLIRRSALLAIEWSSLRTEHSKTLQQGFIPLMKNLITLFVFLMGSIMTLKHFDYDVMSLITALGVGSLAVGLAAKETLSNMISGFTLIIDRNLHPGDRINLGGSIGDVEEIGLRSTRIRTPNGNMLVVPNSDMVNNKILNYSSPSRAVLCTATIRVPYTTPFLGVREKCLAVLKEVEWIDVSRGMSVQLTSLADGVQLVSIYFWVLDLQNEGAAVSEFNQKLLHEFTQSRIAFAAAPPPPAPV